ncbi:hypothetical protein [Chitiniphilus eburneus]|uniref:Uncharacterized protein n=1 Tax=Chitiniphilus eburneus TaxID=2571148 RepID=A0A4U0QET2_9NEIS|nr:hypothetical protein [Chitiniphilus eburneus]TJZ79182.1 hypothetical protein FAZ21_02535 [Chitiniphilus eburneus]
MSMMPFVAGLLAGVAAVRLVRNKQTKAGLDQAQTRLRQATVTGLGAIEASSARLREKLAVVEVPEAPEAVEPVAIPAVEAVPRKRAPRKSGTATPRAKARPKPDTAS